MSHERHESDHQSLDAPDGLVRNRGEQPAADPAGTGVDGSGDDLAAIVEAQACIGLLGTSIVLKRPFWYRKPWYPPRGPHSRPGSGSGR
jgi:hypothetical protein